jgi:hypothetical protein
VGLNHVDGKLVYTNRTRLKIIHPRGGLVIQVESVFDGSLWQLGIDRFIVPGTFGKHASNNPRMASSFNNL